jgi:Co/Zn/Cd efflux system component
VWTLGAGRDAIMVHVTTETKDNGLAPVVERALRAAFSVEYVTVQVEPEDASCAAPPSRFEESADS